MLSSRPLNSVILFLSSSPIHTSITTASKLHVFPSKIRINPRSYSSPMINVNTDTHTQAHPITSRSPSDEPFRGLLLFLLLSLPHPHVHSLYFSPVSFTRGSFRSLLSHPQTLCATQSSASVFSPPPPAVASRSVTCRRTPFWEGKVVECCRGSTSFPPSTGAKRQESSSKASPYCSCM